MSPRPQVRPDRGTALLELYDQALPQVYGYLIARCDQRQSAEDLTAETFLAADEPYGRAAQCADDQGLPFAVFTPPGGVAPAGSPPPAAPGESRPGDTVYLTYEVPDSARARAFFGALLGWEFTPGRVEDCWAPTGDPWPMAFIA